MKFLPSASRVSLTTLTPLLVLASLGLAQERSNAPLPQVEVAGSFPAATPESQGISVAALEGLVAEVNNYVERDMLVGAELLVIKNRRTVLHTSFGHSDREGETSWAPGTVCNIRSMTKPLTGAAAQLLIDRGELELQDVVAKYLPGFDTEKSRGITVEQILTHRSGLPLTVLTSMGEFESLVDMGNAAGKRGPEFGPGSRFWYSDAGTDVLGAVVEVVSGKRIDEFVREELLVPLGMTESFYFVDDEDPRRTRIASLYAGGAGHWKRFLDPDDGAFYPFAWGSQSLYSTPEDYAKFLAMWMDGGRVGEQQLLSAAAVKRTLTPASPMTMMGSDVRFPTSITGQEVMYGQMSVLHVPLDSDGKQPATIVGHSGSDGTIAWAWPKRDLMILFFTQSRGGGAALRLEEALDRLLITPDSHLDVAQVPEEVREFLGLYIADWSNHMKEEFIIEYRSGKLTLDVPSQMRFELVPVEGEEVWTFAIAPVVKVWFERDEQGAVDCLRIEQGPMVFEAPRKGSAHEAEFTEQNKVDPEQVAKYLGTYHDRENDTDVEARIDGDYLAIETKDGLFHLWKVPGAAVWQLREQPMVTISFQEKDDKVLSITLHPPGGGELVALKND